MAWIIETSVRVLAGAVSAFAFIRLSHRRSEEKSLLVQHHDKTRERVSYTALGVAGFRALEALGRKEDALVKDPYIDELPARLFRFEWLSVPPMDKQELAQLVTTVSLPFASSSVEEEHAALTKLASQHHRGVAMLAHYTNLLAVRTRWFDAALQSCTRAGIVQVVVLGAGLDARPYRLEGLEKVHWFEVDFAPLFDYKNEILGKSGATSRCERLIQTCANLVTDDWGAALCRNGLDKQSPIVWILEGLTGYFTEGELREMLQRIRQLSCSESHILATFVGCQPAFDEKIHHPWRKHTVRSSMHKFATNSPLALLESFGFAAPPPEQHVTAQTLLIDEAQRHGRMVFAWCPYWLVHAQVQ